MTEPGAKQDVMLKLKTIVTVIITTGIVISGVWAFFLSAPWRLKTRRWNYWRIRMPICASSELCQKLSKNLSNGSSP